MSEMLETTGPGAVDPRAEQRMVPMRDGVTPASQSKRSATVTRGTIARRAGWPEATAVHCTNP